MTPKSPPLIAAHALQVEVHERDMLATETVGVGQLTLYDLPRDAAVPRTLRLGAGGARLMLLLEAKGFGLVDREHRGSTGTLKVHVVRAMALQGPPGSRPSPAVHVAVGRHQETTRPDHGTLEPEWRESFVLPVKLWPDTKEAAEKLRIGV